VVTKSTRFAPPLSPRQVDAEVDRVFRDHAARLKELQAMPAAALGAPVDVELVDGAIVAVPHLLGRRPSMVLVSPARGGAATVEEVRDSNHDRTKYVVLRAAVALGGSVTVTVGVL
jgi:hypothetical protein